jgi:hypothetical protein
MKQFIADFVGWMASLLLVATATTLWAIAALLVWITGNASGTGGSWRFAK